MADERAKKASADKEKALEELGALKASGGGAAAAAPSAEGSVAERSVSFMRGKLSKLGAKKGDKTAEGQPEKPEAEGGADSAQLEQLAAAFSAERTTMREAREKLEAELKTALEQLEHAQQEAKQLGEAPEQKLFDGLQAQLQSAREEREAAREQLGRVTEQLTERMMEVETLQASEAALKADVAALQDDASNGPPRSPAAATTAAEGSVAEAPGSGKKGVTKGWGDRVKEAKERAERAKASLTKKKEIS